MNYSFNTKAYGIGGIALVAAFMVAAGFGAFSATDAVDATGGREIYPTPACPYQPQEGRTIVTFGDDRLVASRAAQHQTRPVSVSLPAGEYEVRMASYDGYSDRAQADPVGQSREQWKGVLRNGSTLVAETGMLNDLQDGVNEASLRGVVNESLVLSQNVTTVIGVHAFAPSKYPESVVPTCLVFDKKEDLNIDLSSLFEVRSTQSFTSFTSIKPITSAEVVAPVVVASPAPTQPDVCPISPKEGRTIVYFNERIRSDQSQSNAVTSLKSVSLPAGTYTVTLSGSDSYEGREKISPQPKEQWYIAFKNGNTTIAQSGVSSDLADNVRTATKTEVVNQALVLPQSVTAVQGVHAFYPDTTNPNSLNPTCAAFDKHAVVVPTPKPAPVCEMTMSNQVIEKGASATLSWTGTNVQNVTINQGVGVVANTGSKAVSPDTTTTYTGTFIGTNGDTITCKATVTVKPKPEPQPQPKAPQPPVCPIEQKDGRTIIHFSDRVRSDQGESKAKSAEQSVSLAKGAYSVTLVSWDGYIGRENVTQPKEQWKVVLGSNDYSVATNVIKDVPDKVVEATVVEKVNDNNFVLTQNVSKAYAMHAFYPDTTNPNSVNPICAAFDKKPEPKPEPKPAPVCEMKVKDQIISKGATTTLSWTGNNISTVTINQGIGSVIKNDSKAVSPDTTTTYAGTFVGINGETITCDATVTVKQPEAPLAPVCAMSVSPSSIRSSSDEVTLTWSSENVTSATINQGVGSIAVNGSQAVTPGEAKTYTGTFVGKNNETVTCSASVTFVRSGGGGGGPCLNCNGGGTTVTTTPTPRPEPRPEPRVEVESEVVRATPGSFIYLDQMPYTGFEAGPFMTAFFWLGLLIVSAGISYLIVVKRVFSQGLRLVAGGHAEQDAWDAYDVAPTPNTFDNRFPKATREHVRRSVVAAPVSLTSNYSFHAPSFDDAYANDTPTEERVETRAQRDSILFSPEALQAVASRVDVEGDDYLETLIEDAKEAFPREDGWILLSMERIKKLMQGSDDTPAPVAPAPVAQNGNGNGNGITATHESAFRRVAATITDTPRVDTSSDDRVNVPVQRQAQSMTGNDVKSAASARTYTASNGEGFGTQEVATFVAWLSENNQQQAFEFLRKMSSQGHSVEQFIGAVVRELDEVYKNRIEGDRTPNMALVKETAVWSNGDFERVLGTLVESVDYSYQSSRVGTKVALAKVFEFFASKNAKQANR